MPRPLPAAALGLDRIDSLTFEAAGRYYQFGQAPAPELPWPAFDVAGHVADLTTAARYLAGLGSWALGFYWELEIGS